MLSREKCLKSVLHQADQILRKLLSEAMQDRTSRSIFITLLITIGGSTDSCKNDFFAETHFSTKSHRFHIYIS